MHTLPLLAVLLATCAAERAGARRMSEAEAARELAERDDVTVVDVRSPAEHAEGHLRGCTLIDVDGPDFARRVEALPRDATYFLYCRSGGRSGRAAKAMARMGFADVVNIGGFSALAEAGAPVGR